MKSCFIFIKNKKYNVTEFINEHPGGSEVFIDGKDMTNAFDEAGHSVNAIKMLEKYLVKSEPNEKGEEKLKNTSLMDFLLFRQTKVSKLPRL